MSSHASDLLKVGVVGLGDMGGAMARAMRTAGLDLVVHDLRSGAVAGLVEAGAAAASSLEDLAQRCQLISVVVLDDRQVLDVVPPLLAAAAPGSTVIVHSTVMPSTVTALADEAASRAIDLVDAAVSGGAEKGVRGDLTVMVGGPDHVVERCRPVLEAVGGQIFHVGPVGAGVAAKIVNNLLTLGTYTLQLEAMQIAAAHGIDEDVVTMVVSASQGDSRLIRTWGRMDRIRRERREQRDAWEVYEQIGKDLRTAAKVAGAQEIIAPVTALAAAVLSTKLSERDRMLDERGADAAVPRCDRCGQELAAPFRAGGRHPECAGKPATSTRAQDAQRVG